MDRIDAMRAFITVVSEGSFTRAADRLDTSPQLVSKYVSKLEERLDVRLLNRTTRRVHLTEAGERYLPRARQLLDDIDDMENQLGDLQSGARGVLRVSAPVSFAALHLGKLLRDFQHAHPAVSVDLQLNDRKVDIVEEGFDIALRIGQLQSSSLVARLIAPIRMVICASPDYLDAHGTPDQLADLSHHRYLRYTLAENLGGATLEAALRGGEIGLVSNNGDVLVQAAIEGAGIVVQPTFIVGPAIAAGQLQVVLGEFEPQPLGLYAVFAHRQLLASKLRCFIDFIDGYFGEPPSWDCFASS